MQNYCNMRRLIIICAFLTCTAQCAKILGVFEAPAHSHYVLGFRLMKALAMRGHDVTIVSAHKEKVPVKNLQLVHLTGLAEETKIMRKNRNLFEFGDHSAFLGVYFIGLMGTRLTEFTLEHEAVQTLLKSNATFDLVIKEQFVDDALHGFAHHFNAPSVVLSTLGSSTWTNRLVGNPGPPSYVPDIFLSYSSRMTFLQRTHNTLVFLFQELYAHLYQLPRQNELLHKYFPTAPHIYNLMYNTSLILLNSHVSYDSPVPHVPNMIEIGGYHVEPPKKLPEDLQKYLDDATEGVVYFCMGSNLRSSDLPTQTVEAILKVFAGLNMKILWKWEDDNLPGQPANVKIQKWLPQQDVLAHPNIKLFITHGGLLSTIEAIYHGVPVVGIPVFGDQKMNMANAVSNGYAVLVPYKELSEQTLARAINEIIYNPKYAENARKRSQLMHDQQVKPIDRATYWIEYVIKHKGAPHLRSAAIDLQWYQVMLLDVVVFLVLVDVILFALLYIIVKKIFGRNRKHKQKTN